MRKKPELTDNQIKELFYRVMRDMILEIRYEAYEKKDMKTFYEANLIHNLPAVLRNDKSTTESEKLQSSYDWFSAHMAEGSRYAKYLEKQVLIVLDSVAD